MHRISITLLISLQWVLLNAHPLGSAVPGEKNKQDSIAVLVVYYSVTGNTQKMAEAVIAGAQKVPSVTAFLKTPDKVTAADLKMADVILIGSPTYYGNMAGPVKGFIDDWWLDYKVSLVDKIGAAFSTGGGESGGKEHVIYSLIIAMMNAGMIIAGPVEGMLGGTGVTALSPVSENALKEASSLGERAANIALKFKAAQR
jgi:NAD(P)H dehydrogenase (quinone)